MSWTPRAFTGTGAFSRSQLALRLRGWPWDGPGSDQNDEIPARIPCTTGDGALDAIMLCRVAIVAVR